MNYILKNQSKILYAFKGFLRFKNIESEKFFKALLKIE